MQTAHRVTQFRESTIRDMTRLAIQHGAINLSQGYPDFDTAETILEAAVQAMREGLNQYTTTWGYPPLRQKLAQMYTERLGWEVDPEVHVTVTCGVTEGLLSTMLAVLDPGDEIIIFEPAHENFRPTAFMAGATPVAVPLEAPAYRLTQAALETAVTPRTKAILINTPQNPTGRVIDSEELEIVIDFVCEHDLILITDEIYDRILYDGRQHISPGSLEPIRERTVTIGGLGKTFAVTGWRLGHIIAPAPLARAIRPVHDYATICAATPLQAAAVAALNMPSSYHEQNTVTYHQRRQIMMDIFDAVGFEAIPPEGAYYVMADFSGLSIPQAQWEPMRFAQWMTTEVGVAVVPGTSFYSLPGYGTTSVRFAFPKKLETLHQAGDRMLAKLR